MKLRKSEEGGASFYCEGCKEMHHVDNTWQIDFDTDTISPSVLTWVEPNPEANAQRKPEWEKFRLGFRCHSFVTNGRIQYLGDCTHALAGQTVELRDVSTLSNIW